MAGIEEVSPGVIRATGEDSLVALYETTSDVLIQLCYLPSGPGRRWVQRSVHGRRGSMTVPPDRSGRCRRSPARGSRVERRRAPQGLGGFELEGVAASFFGPKGPSTTMTFADVDAATIAIELDDFADAVFRPPAAGSRRAGRPSRRGRRVGGRRIAASAAAVLISDVADGTVRLAQQPVDEALGLFDDWKGTQP